MAVTPITAWSVRAAGPSRWTITQATPTISTTPSAGGPVGTSIFDMATITSGVNPTGTVTFNLFGPGDATCTAPPVFTSNVSVVDPPDRRDLGILHARRGGHLPVGGHLQR